MSNVGIIIAHGVQPETARGKLLAQLATRLAQAGHLVVRYQSHGKEQRRQRVFEKVLDTAAGSPFARHVSRWMLMGIGHGARIAAYVGSRCRELVAGYVLLAYPLTEPFNTAKGGMAPDSSGPLSKLQAPILFIQPDSDPLCPAGPAGIPSIAHSLPAWDVRLVQVQGADAAFRDPSTRAPPTAEMRQQLIQLILTYVDALAAGKLESAGMPCIKSSAIPSSPAAPASLRAPLQLPQHHVLGQQLLSHGLLPSVLMPDAAAMDPVAHP